MNYIGDRRAAFLAIALVTGSLVAAAQSKIVVEPSIASSVRSNAAVAENSTNYLIGAGDVLQVEVLKEAEASAPTVMVQPDGMITLPLIKSVKAAGLTPGALAEVIAGKLNSLIREPEVTVLVKEIHSQKIYVLGAVRKEGPIAIQAPITILQAIAEAGGLTDYAKRHKIYVIRTIGGNQSKFLFDYPAVLEGRHPEQNISLLPSDTLVVP